METLSCNTPQMGEKEMWVYLLAYNLIRLLMAQSALMACAAKNAELQVYAPALAKLERNSKANE